VPLTRDYMAAAERFVPHADPSIREREDAD
jgi:hypothetical protein